MKIKKAIMIVVFLMYICIANAISFYSGNVIIKNINSEADIQDSANVVLNYTLSGNEKVDLNFNNVPESAVIRVNGIPYGSSFNLDIKGEVSIVVAYSLAMGAETMKQISINPNLLFNSMVNSNKIGRYNLKIKLPANVNELLSSTEKAANIELLQGRKVYSWEKTGAYASTLTVTWQSLNVNIEVERIVPQEIEGVFAVKNIIRNNGGAISGVLLLQSFLESDFDPVSPLEEFKKIQDGNDRRLEWKKEIQSMPSGTVQEFTYSLKALNRGENVLFRPLYVYVGNVLVKIVEKQEYTTRGIGSANVDETKYLEKEAISSATLPQPNPREAQLLIKFVNKTSRIEAVSEGEDGLEQAPGPGKGDKESSGPANFAKKLGEFIRSPKVLLWSIASIILLSLGILLFTHINRNKN